MRMFPCELPYNGTALICFGTQSCVPCKSVTPIFFELEDAYSDIAFHYCDLSMNGDRYRQMFNVFGVPTIIVLKFHNGDMAEVDRISGAYPKQKYVDLIEKYSK